MDMLVANNDRTSNVLFDVEKDVVQPIDNDDSFVAGRRKAFSRNLFRALTVYDVDLAKALEKFFDERSDEDLANTIFASYSPKQALRYAKETRERFQKVFLRAIEKQEPIERSP
jgi:AICAR transformylase/IMP cyclohydrolase PurH